MRRQKILAIVCACLFIVMAVAYFAVIAPYFERNTVSEDEETAPELEEGESLGALNRIFMFDSIAADDISKITVENEYGGFVFVKDSQGKLVIDGYENLPLDSEKVSLLKNVTGSTLSIKKVWSNCTDEKLSEYGLLEPKASWVVEATDGRTFKAYVGDELLTGGGYYCMVDGRRTVYVLSTDIASTIITPAEGYVTPIICAGISQDDYYTVDKFTVYKDGEKMLRIKLVDKDKQLNPDALAETIMDYPTSYYPNATLLYEIIYDYMGQTADSCYSIDISDEERAEIGMDDPAHVITFEYNDYIYELYFSQMNEDGTYYTETNMYPGVIGVASASELYYLEYTMIDWVDPYIFQQYITNLSDITVIGRDTETKFELSHAQDAGGNTTVLYVKANGASLAEDQVANFRQFYKGLLALRITDYYADDEYCTKTDEEMEALISDEANAYMVLKFTTLDGEENTLAFYRYSTGHSAVTVNGVGEFYLSTDLVDKVLNDLEKILAGEEVTANSKY